MQSGRIRDDENINDFEGMTPEEITKMLREREARAQAQILEMVCAGSASFSSLLCIFIIFIGLIRHDCDVYHRAGG